ncbi:MAG: polysaccharide deacetylase family protein, partial [Phycisphaerales bacterium]|nr:polysaccharide deacetylase family protein [Phycisphaerales bacterium]
MPLTHERPALIFSVDVEDWGQSVLDRSLPISQHSAENVRRLLGLLAAHPDAQATFFVLGKFAERHPDVIRRIDAAGHEIACHGHGHMEVYRLGPDGFREDLRRAVGILADITGRRPRGYRAPVFSITSDALWALDILQQEGFEYDSSIYPYAGRRYGIHDWPIHPCRVKLDAHRSIIEYPLTVKTFASRRWPISGGGAARLIPQRLLIHWLHHASTRRYFPSHPSPPSHRSHTLPKLTAEAQRTQSSELRNLNSAIGDHSHTSKLSLLSALSASPRCIPLAFRLSPFAFPPVFYCHPYELDPHEF